MTTRRADIERFRTQSPTPCPPPEPTPPRGSPPTTGGGRHRTMQIMNPAAVLGDPLNNLRYPHSQHCGVAPLSPFFATPDPSTALLSDPRGMNTAVGTNRLN